MTQQDLITAFGDIFVPRLLLIRECWRWRASPNAGLKRMMKVPCLELPSTPAHLAYGYIGKDYCLSLVKADYIGQYPSVWHRGHGDLLQLLACCKAQTILKVKTESGISNAWCGERKVEAVDVVEGIAQRSAPECRLQ